jgi:glycosyltransferase involved in cell wall biosynthesis/SAM-dependent methyltransferase
MPRIGILVVAYNAASTLAQVLDRIPPAFRARVDRVLVCDDHSQDSTYLVGLGYQRIAPDLPLEVIRHPRNLGYGGNQKAGYRWAIEHGLDVVVLLHGDGQYAPELLPDMVEPLERGDCDAVLGSRMLEQGAARAGGMPLYKYVGNRILTRVENTLMGLDLSEWHSGYRAYRVDALRHIPFEANSDGFNFDTQVLIQLHEAGRRISEIPIPTYYGDEICYVDGLRYARDVSTDVVRYRAHKMGFGSGETAFATTGYELKEAGDASHSRVLAWLSTRPPSRVLDLGCSDGALAAHMRKLGHEVTGVDSEELPGARDRVDRLLVSDLDRGIPEEAGRGYDVVVVADVLEHLREPDHLLADARQCLAPGGSVIASVPNFSHWYPRARVALGLFDYDRRGILDHGHVRFFTRRSFERLAERQRYSIRRSEAVGLPFEVLGRGGGESGSDQGARLAGLAQRLNRASVALRPSLFAYQLLYELAPLPQKAL